MMSTETYAQTVTRVARASRDATEGAREALDVQLGNAASAAGIAPHVAVQDVADEIQAIADDDANRRAGLVEMIRNEYKHAVRRGERAYVLAEFLFYDKYGFQRYDTTDYGIYDRFEDELRNWAEGELQKSHELRLPFNADC